MADDFIIKYSDLIGKDATFDELIADIQKLKKELLALAKVSKKAMQGLKPDDAAGIDKATKEVKEYEQGVKNLIKTEKVLQTTKKKTIDLTQEELVEREKQKLIQRERIQLAKQQAIINKEEKNSIASLRAQLSKVTLEWKKYTSEELKNTKEGRKAFETKKRLTTQLKKLEKATGDHRREVGNYGIALRKLNGISSKVRKGLLRLFVGRTIIDGIARIGGALKGLVDDFKDSDPEVAKVAASLDKITGAAKQVGLIFLKLVSGPLFAFVDIAEKASKAVFGIGFGAEKASVGVKQLQTEFNAEIEVLRRGNISAEAREKLIGDMNEKYKDILPDVISLTAGEDELTAAQEAGNAALEKRFLLYASQEKFEELGKRRLAALEREVELSQQLAKAEATAQTAANLTGTIGFQAQLLAQKGVDITRERIAANQLVLDGINEEAKALKDLQTAQGISDAQINDSQAKRDAAKKAADDAKKTRTKETKEKKKEIVKSAAEIALEEAKLEAERLDREAAQSEKRLAAIQSLIQEIEKLEAEGIEDKTERLLELERLRFEEETKLRKTQIEVLKAETRIQGGDVQEVVDIGNRKAEAQERAHLKTMEEIRSDANLTRLQKKSAERKKLQEEEKKLRDTELEAQEEADAEAEKANKEIFKRITESAQKAGELITELFEKQADLSKASVDEQVQNLERGRDRASKGLETNLAFEEEDLAKRQAEQQRREKEAKQAASIVALFNIVSAYAASGEKNALARGLVDWSLLKTFESFFEGTEDTGVVGQPLDNKGGRMAILHNNERVVPKALNQQLDGMSNQDLVNNAILGSSMGDYFPTSTPSTQNTYSAQRDAFNEGLKVQATGNGEIVQAIKTLQKQVANQPNYSAQIVQSQEDVISLMISEQKKGMRKIYQKVLRAKK
jgi:hypothetical protein